MAPNFLHLLLLGAAIQVACATSACVTEIQGISWQSPLAGQVVTDVFGIVTAKSAKSGFWIMGEPSGDPRNSNGLQIYTTSNVTLARVEVGDIVSLSGTITEYRSSSSPSDLFATQMEYPTNIQVISSNNTATPVVLGKDRSPPTQLLSSLDVGPDGWLSVPGNVSSVENVNATLQPDLYGLDFWKSLEGQLVTVPGPVAIGFPDNYGEFWAHGNWVVTGKNSRGGLSIVADASGIPDANPETIFVGSPLDGTKNPKVTMGTTLTDIAGVIVYQFDYYYILPLTAPTIKTNSSTLIPPSSITPSGDACTITIGDYNVDNFAYNSKQVPVVASHIVQYLNQPDIVFLQEIQDNSGPTDDGTVDANKTLSTLVAAISSAGGTVKYAYSTINPLNDQDGGQPGGNIRPAYLYNPSKISLIAGPPVGGPLDATSIVGSGPNISLSFNPGRIDPTNDAWNSSRKPLVAQWATSSGSFFTVNVQLVAKLDSTSTAGDARPPINSGVDQRTTQANLVANFVKSVLAENASANVVVGGDFNEYAQTRSVFSSFSSILAEADEVANIPPVERYTYVFEQNSQQLDHLFISKALQDRGVQVEHVHVNNWAPNLAARASDHDPSVMKIRIC